MAHEMMGQQTASVKYKSVSSDARWQGWPIRFHRKSGQKSGVAHDWLRISHLDFGRGAIKAHCAPGLDCAGSGSQGALKEGGGLL